MRLQNHLLGMVVARSHIVGSQYKRGRLCNRLDQSNNSENFSENFTSITSPNTMRFTPFFAALLLCVMKVEMVSSRGMKIITFEDGH